MTPMPLPVALADVLARGDVWRGDTLASLPEATIPSGYSELDARALLTALGVDGRTFYLGVQHRLDTVFLALEALALALTFPRLFPRLLAGALIAVSLAGTVFDWLENAAVAGLLRADPAEVTAQMIATSSQWSVLKATCVSVAMTALLIGVALAVWRRLRAR